MTERPASVDTIGGRYRLGARIGTGGTAGVYAGHDERLDRPVAIKVIDAAAAITADPTTTRRFVVEARAAAGFVHPHAVAVFDAGIDEERLFIVMELVGGGSLAERLGRTGPLDSTEAATLGAQIAGALEAAHRVGIIHRDVKPANILLDGAGNAKLADFGIARRFDELEESLTTTGMIMGTRRYVSPEQAQGQPLGPATDIFSLGVTLYEAVTGTPPPSAAERPAGHVLDVRTVNARIEPALAAVIARATAVPVEARFPTAAALATALGAATSPMPSGATAPMPAHLLPVATPADAVTTIAPASVSASVPRAAPAGLFGTQLQQERRHRRRMMLVGGLGALVVLGLVALVVALRGDDPASTVGEAPSSVVTIDPATTQPPTTIAPTTLAPTTLASTTLAPTTVAPTTVAPTTAPPTTVAPPTSAPVVELVPGFPLPVDPATFLLALQIDPELVGPRGEDLAEGFERVLDSPPGRREDRADDLRRDIEKWTDHGELDPAVANVALDFLDDIDGADPGDGRDDG